MARKKKHAEHVNHERWLVSYADFITLLFAFFVVMFAASKADSKKTAQFSEAVQVAFKDLSVFTPSSKSVSLDSAGGTEANKIIGSPTPGYSQAHAEAVVPSGEKSDIHAVKAQLQQMLKEEMQQNVVRITEDSRGITVSLAEAGFFDPGSASVKPAGLQVLQRIAEKLRQIPQNLRVEGHTDNIPIHTAQFPSNWELSTARATNVLEYLITNADVPPERLSAVGYGQYRPTASNEKADGRAANRRVDLVIIGAAAQQLEPEKK